MVVDDFTRECLALVVDTSFSGMRVTRELDAFVEAGGRPLMIVSDNGTELTSRAILQWQEDNRIEWHYIAPGKPTQNGFVERLNSRFGGECLNERLFRGMRCWIWWRFAMPDCPRALKGMAVRMCLSPVPQFRAQGQDDPEMDSQRPDSSMKSKAEKQFGWGTWIRTRTNGVRVRGSTVNLFPNVSAAGPTRDPDTGATGRRLVPAAGK